MNPSQFQEIQQYPHIKSQCAITLDLFVSDLRSMLQLPLLINKQMPPTTSVPLIELTGGCNFISCSTILDIIAGLSVCLYVRNSRIGFDTEHNHDRGLRFRELLENYYPWDPYENLERIEVSNVLWNYLRNPLVHNLGILPFGNTTINAVNINRFQINKNPLGPQEITELESISRPINLFPTFDLDNSTFNITVTCLYWGLHQLFRNLFSDHNQMSQVETWYENRI